MYNDCKRGVPFPYFPDNSHLSPRDATSLLGANVFWNYHAGSFVPSTCPSASRIVPFVDLSCMLALGCFLGVCSFWCVGPLGGPAFAQVSVTATTIQLQYISTSILTGAVFNGPTFLFSGTFPPLISEKQNCRECVLAKMLFVNYNSNFFS